MAKEMAAMLGSNGGAGLSSMGKCARTRRWAMTIRGRLR